MINIETEGGYIKVGQNVKENWQLLDEASDYHWWFHLDAFPSPHVFLSTVKPSKSQLYKCARYCQEYSKYKNYKNLYVIYTQRKNVKKGTKEGEVIPQRTERIKL
jgi:predicted ribosome quality control (RQC) complex YloA/Tae2 family protein